MPLPEKKILPIGIFDSGLGGLTVLKAITELLPNESTVYFGDTARVPYGTKSAKTVTRFSFENADFLQTEGIKLLVVACNTASAYSFLELQEYCSVPVIGVIKSGALAAAKKSKTGNIGVIGTEGTVKSSVYEKVINKLLPSANVFQQHCPLLVPLVEEGWLDGEVTHKVVETYLKTFVNDDNTLKIDTLLLGCTHYPLLRELFQEVLGKEVSLIDSAVETANTVKAVLEYMKLACDSKTQGFNQFYVSDLSDRFRRVGELILGKELIPIKEVSH